MGKWNDLEKTHDKGQFVKKYTESGERNPEWSKIHDKSSYPKDKVGGFVSGSITQDADEFIDYEDD